MFLPVTLPLGARLGRRLQQQQEQIIVALPVVGWPLIEGKHSMASRNRGVKKPTLRDLSILPPNKEEQDALHTAFFSRKDQISVAILGTAIVEHNLDILLKEHMRRKDDQTWAELLSDAGPFGTFNAKILAGYAFGIYEKETRENFHIVRRIRNAFAHSKKLISFEDDFIIDEYLKIRIPKTATKVSKNALQMIKDRKHNPTNSFVLLCLVIHSEMLRRQVKRIGSKLRRRIKRNVRRQAQEPFFGALNAVLNARGELPKNWLVHYQNNKTAGLTDQVPVVAQPLPHPRQKTDKDL